MTRYTEGKKIKAIRAVSRLHVQGLPRSLNTAVGVKEYANANGVSVALDSPKVRV